VMLLLAFTPGMAGAAIAIAARMAFVLILLAAVLPWLGRGEALDPHALPDALLPSA
jgi:Mg2+/Co2+ transporter CorB